MQPFVPNTFSIGLDFILAGTLPWSHHCVVPLTANVKFEPPVRDTDIQFTQFRYSQIVSQSVKKVQFYHQTRS